MSRHLYSILSAIFSWLTIAMLLTPLACTRELNECEGPEINFAELNSARKSVYSNGSRAVLVMPNPIDATKNPQALASDAALTNLASGFALPGLTDSTVLDNGFLKVRIKEIDDALSTLAKPDASGQFKFSATDVHYSETMAYYSISAMMRYIEGLGFSFVKSRPLYVMVRAEDPDDENAINAYYEHNYLNPSKPRTMRMIGKGQYTPGVDRDMYWHELGHFANESISKEVGMDFAADNGAVYTEASAIHECTADYMAESLGDKNYIGRWINRAIEPSKPGEPLRVAVDRTGDILTYGGVASASSGKIPERYEVAEWCTRALWNLRSQFVKEGGANGSVISDRVILTAISRLKRDASLKEFYNAIQETDQKLHCGIHKRSIRTAFESRGFDTDADSLDEPLAFEAQPIRNSNGLIDFQVRITNNQKVTAKNVRLKLDARGFRTLQYQQGYGDLAPGASIVIGNNGLGFIYGVTGMIDNSTTSGNLGFRLSVLVENGPTATKEGDVR